MHKELQVCRVKRVTLVCLGLQGQMVLQDHKACQVPKVYLVYVAHQVLPEMLEYLVRKAHQDSQVFQEMLDKKVRKAAGADEVPKVIVER